MSSIGRSNGDLDTDQNPPMYSYASNEDRRMYKIKNPTKRIDVAHWYLNIRDFDITIVSNW